MSDSAAEPEPATPEPSVAGPSSVAGPDFAAARSWPEGAPPAAALGHRRDGRIIQVRVEPTSLAAYQELSVDAPMPDGARVVAWHESPSGTLLDGYLLEKRAGAWSARLIDAQGRLVPGEPLGCLRCHDMAPHGRRLPSAPPAGVESIHSAPR